MKLYLTLLLVTSLSLSAVDIEKLGIEFPNVLAGSKKTKQEKYNVDGNENLLIAYGHESVHFESTIYFFERSNPDGSEMMIEDQLKFEMDSIPQAIAQMEQLGLYKKIEFNDPEMLSLSEGVMPWLHYSFTANSAENRIRSDIWLTIWKDMLVKIRISSSDHNHTAWEDFPTAVDTIIHQKAEPAETLNSEAAPQN